MRITVRVGYANTARSSGIATQRRGSIQQIEAVQQHVGDAGTPVDVTVALATFTRKPVA